MMIAPDQIDPDAAKVVLRLRQAGHLAYLVGGCVRDLMLERRPKDFDVATNATPPELRRLFRNCRIIGRRFRLAHIFFGPKIIETSTFRANPREVEEEATDGPETESGDLLIRRDNVFGSAEEDARRRDFTINGLFYDIEQAKIVDYVDGLRDLEARLVRTIGDPDIRFREDPIRILRAVKFAARCDLTIEPETYRLMLAHRGEIARCAQARVSEEFYRLLRGGAARRSMELLVETGLLEILVPDLARALTQPPADEEAVLWQGRLWAYLAALDVSAQKRAVPPSNALVLATLLLPPLRDALDPDSANAGDVGQLVATSIQPFLERVRASRRDGELARQILLALRYILPGRHERRRPRLAGRDFYDDAVTLAAIVVEAETAKPELAGRPSVTVGAVEGAPTVDEGAAGTDDDGELPPELTGGDEIPGRRRRRRRRGGQGGPGVAAGGAPMPSAAGARQREPAPQPPARAASMPARPTHTPLPVVLPPLLDRPSFLGTGAFGGPWSVTES